MPDTASFTPTRLLAGLLEQQTGQILSEGRHWRMDTLLKPVIRAHGVRDMVALAAAIRSQPDGVLARASVNALLNNETRFFRDPHIFHMLGDVVLPAMMANAAARGNERLLRFWCAGCSTGQEAYSLAMMLRQYQERWPGWRFEILATDISTDAIERAEQGLFTQAEVQRGLPINHLLRWFEPADDKWHIHDDIRQMIDFRVDNLFVDGHPSGLYDLILCRNVLMYFPDDRQKQILNILSRHCVSGGNLILGAGETVIGQCSDFSASRTFRGMYEMSHVPVTNGAYAIGA